MNVQAGQNQSSTPTSNGRLRLIELQQIRKRRLIFFCALIISDIVAIVLPFASLHYLRNEAALDHRLLSLTVFFVVTTFVMSLANGGYSREALSSPRISFKAFVLAISFASLMFFIVAFGLKDTGSFSRLIVSGSLALAIFLALGSRYLIHRKAVKSLGPHCKSSVLILDSVAMPPPQSEFQPNMVLCANEFALRPDLSDPASMYHLGALLKGLDQVYVKCEEPRYVDWGQALKTIGISASLLLEEPRLKLGLGYEKLGNLCGVVVNRGALSIRQRTLKRLSDLCFVALALPFLLPLMAVLAIAIKLDSPGPIFFRQQRIGRDNQKFEMLKFRSMRVDASDQSGVRSTGRNDDRITRLGKFLRTSSLDEIPQFLNVLIGDMSIVGPRPHAMGSRAEDKLFWEIDEQYWHRHCVKPGLTGLAQVRGYRGATEKEADLINRLDSDLKYVADWSLRQDFIITLRTVFVLVHKNAF